MSYDRRWSDRHLTAKSTLISVKLQSLKRLSWHACWYLAGVLYSTILCQKRDIPGCKERTDMLFGTIRNILSQSRSKPIFAGFKAKSRSLKRRSHKKCRCVGWSYVVHSSVPETRCLRVHRFTRIPFGNWTKYCLEVGTDTFSLRWLWISVKLKSILVKVMSFRFSHIVRNTKTK